MLNDPSTKYLAEFVTLVETGNYMEAAEKLFTSQSSLSKHIRALEQDTGHTVLVRAGKRLLPTRFGELLLEYARRFVALDRAYQEEKAAFETNERTDVRVAVSPHMNCDHMVNMLWDHFSGAHAEYRLFTGEFNSFHTLEQVFAMGYELVFYVSQEQKHPVFGCFPWAADSIAAVLPLDHPLAARPCVHLKELAQEPFVLPSDISPLQSILLRLCKDEGFRPTISMTIHGGRNLSDMVASGIGVALAPFSDVPIDPTPRAAAVELAPPVPIYLNLYYQKDKPLSKAADAFLAYAIDIHQHHERDIPFFGPEGPVENVYFE